MIKSFLVSMFAIFLFALGATGSWFYLNLETEKTDGDAQLPVTPVVAESRTDPFPSFQSTVPDGLPAVVRGPEVGPEDLFRIEAAMTTRKEQLREYEELLRKQQSRMKVTDADTKAAQREVEGALGQVRSLMDSAESLLGEIKTAMNNLQQQKEEVQQEMEELEALKDEAGNGTVANMKTIGELLQSMPPEKAANTIVEMINDGKMDFTIQVLRNVEPRNASKILAEILDSQILSELISRMPGAPILR